jgi:nucleoside-diphosphate-sugar epimerase
MRTVKILLTGGSGFVGRRVLETLSGEHRIVAPTRRELDVTDAVSVDRMLERGRFDVIVHAAVGMGDGLFEGALRGFHALERNASRVSRIISFGSGAEYGKHRDLKKVREEEVGAVVPRDSYGFAKLLLNEAARRSGGRILNLRLFGVYGPGEDPLRKFISNTIVKVLAGVDVVIRQDVVFDYLHVDDLVEVLRLVLEHGCDAPDVNVTPTESISLSEVVRLIGEAAGHPVRATYETPGRNLEYTGGNARLRALFPALRFRTYAEGIASLYAYYAGRRECVDVEALRRDEYRARCVTREEAGSVSP